MWGRRAFHLQFVPAELTHFWQAHAAFPGQGPMHQSLNHQLLDDLPLHRALVGLISLSHQLQNQLDICQSFILCVATALPAGISSFGLVRKESFRPRYPNYLPELKARRAVMARQSTSHADAEPSSGSRDLLDEVDGA